MDNLIRDRIIFAVFVAAVLVLVMIAITVMLAFLINASKNNDHTVESVQPVQLEKARSGFVRAKKSAISAPTRKEIANVCRVEPYWSETESGPYLLKGRTDLIGYLDEVIDGVTHQTPVPATIQFHRYGDFGSFMQRESCYLV